jgi:hypothetical protein
VHAIAAAECADAASDPNGEIAVLVSYFALLHAKVSANGLQEKCTEEMQ